MKIGTFAATAALTASAMLAGCGMAINPDLMRGDGGSTQGTLQDADTRQRQIESLDGKPHGMFGKAGQTIGLTTEQKQELRRILREHRPDREEFKARHEELRTLLLAETVDGAALREFLDTRKKEFAARAAGKADMFARMREVLTGQQREDLVARLAGDEVKVAAKNLRKRAKKRFKPKIDSFRKDLNLTESQREALGALKDESIANRQALAPELKQAAIAFLQSGDKVALARTLEQSVLTHVPTDALVAAATALDKEQRAKLVHRFARFADMKHKGHFKRHLHRKDGNQGGGG